jgi:hypothetical protein
MGFIKKHKRPILIGLAVFLLLGAGGLYYFKTSRSQLASSFRAAMGNYLNLVSFRNRPELPQGLTAEDETVWVDGKLGEMPARPGEHDVKVVYSTSEGQVFCDYATGFSVSLPDGMTADVSCSPDFIAFQSADAKIVVSREWAVGEETPDYLEYYFYRFLLSDQYRTANDIELLEQEKTDEWERLTVRLGDFSGSFDTYTYLDLKPARDISST